MATATPSRMREVICATAARKRVWQIAAVTAEVVFGHPSLVKAEFFHLDNLLVHASIKMRQ